MWAKARYCTNMAFDEALKGYPWTPVQLLQRITHIYWVFPFLRIFFQKKLKNLENVSL